MNRFSFKDDPPNHITLCRLDGVSPDAIARLVGREAVIRQMVVQTITGNPDGRTIRLTEARRRLGQRIENGLKIEGRAANDLEHVGGSRLLLQRFAQLVEQAGVLEGNDSPSSANLY